MTHLESGFYWVTVEGKWTIGELTKQVCLGGTVREEWQILGCDDFTKPNLVGERIDR
jgi:hypothetical protein